ncbi:hypothetical protein FB451DRAFT_1173175 [Mycena latifolia]|nr:hypothetical protein FB451DRAFT_1173175 [Mycena latifolia]
MSMRGHRGRKGRGRDREEKREVEVVQGCVARKGHVPGCAIDNVRARELRSKSVSFVSGWHYWYQTRNPNERQERCTAGELVVAPHLEPRLHRLLVVHPNEMEGFKKCGSRSIEFVHPEIGVEGVLIDESELSQRYSDISFVIDQHHLDERVLNRRHPERYGQGHGLLLLGIPRYSPSDDIIVSKIVIQRPQIAWDAVPDEVSFLISVICSGVGGATPCVWEVGLSSCKMPLSTGALEGGNDGASSRYCSIALPSSNWSFQNWRKHEFNAVKRCT